MRIRRLELLRYGHFTDRLLELPATSPDVHIIFGPNEAGKSTALSALEDLLFGIPRNSQLNFLHDYQHMRLGAVIESGSEALAFRRRKGNKDTLLTPEEVPLGGGDGVLAAFLAGADRDFFRRMFFLDHRRLREGGQEILAARDEVGQALFSAGAGLEGLRDHLQELNDRADDLWAPRRAAHRAYYQADDALKAAEAELRERTVTAAEWTRRRQAHEEASQHFAALEAEIQARETELRKLSRIRRVYRDLQHRHALNLQLQALGDVTPLPEDAREDLAAAERDDRDSTARIGALKDQLAAALSEREALVYDEALLRRADEIRQLHERRIAINAEQADLPQRRAALAALESRLQQLARELEWPDASTATIASRIPTRTRINRARVLLGRHGRLSEVMSSGRQALEDAKQRLASIDAQLETLPPDQDMSTLRALLRATRDGGDFPARISAAARDEAHARSALARCLAALRPTVADVASAMALTPPSRETVERHRDDQRALEQRLGTCREQLQAATQERARLERQRAHLVGEQQLVAPETLRQLRAHRDAGWQLIRRRHLQSERVAEEEAQRYRNGFADLAGAFEAAVTRADEAADRRYEQAEESARLSVLDSALRDRTLAAEKLHDEQQGLLDTQQRLASEWQVLWSGSPVNPDAPEQMLIWLEARAELLSAHEARERAARQVEALRAEARAAAAGLLDELSRLELDIEIDRLREQPLSVVLEAAADALHQQQETAKIRRAALDRRREAQQDVARKREQLEEAERQQTAWQAEWRGAQEAIGLNQGDPESAPPQIDALDDMRGLLTQIAQLRDEQIVPAEARLTGFHRDVMTLAAAVAEDLANTDPEEAAVILESRLEAAARTREAHAGKTTDIEQLSKDIEALETARRSALDRVRELQNLASAEGLDALRAAIERSDQQRALSQQLAEVERTLEQQGDGFDLAHLQAESEGADLDRVVAREHALTDELNDLRQRLMEARDHKTEAANTFQAIGGDDGAAEAASDRQAALARMEEIAEAYVRRRATAMLLQWGIDRYRREQQAPLLRRAGQLFTRLTDGAFHALTLAFDAQDRPHLAGVREDGTSITVDGMSTGTADQLYLALRIAAIEDYVRRSGPLPFVADDLFINFDDERAAAGFAVLSELAQSCQVIFFTHHAHLLDVARAALPGAVTVTHLNQPGTSAAQPAGEPVRPERTAG